ncbi:site-specific integrase [Solirubrobacter ginsenosidimutans]|uniref:Site-specific integrase n=1 Tax=Solirubrobacter ginsenosidimutans TaxID=490573 RepID=A0A9X3S1L5_9ACTN|nr:site-specific integrase [Solirubrobacter ginsenosidimutans]MDA0161252.1 site-specific integrase [Solirubrobacter ginsenosidimutans]
MSIDYEPSRDRYRVRWRKNGKQRSRRFATRDEAEGFEASLSPQPEEPEPPQSVEPSGGGVYPYETSDGRRWRFVFRQSDGGLTTRRGFTSRTAATTARGRAIEEVRRGEVRVNRDEFAVFWAALLEAKHPYITPGTLQDYTTHGRKRLLPWFGELRLAAIDEDRVRDWLSDMAEIVADDELSPKTVNNARTCLSMALGEAVRRRHLTQNPCRYVPELPVERAEIDYLRVGEIERYLEACADYYRPLAEFLIGTGARISEALGMRWPDLDLDDGVVRISRQRARGTGGTTPTKGKRFRSVQIGPRLIATLRRVREQRDRTSQPDDGWLFLCPRPLRGRYSRRTEPTPPNRKTAHDWHEWALEDAGLRDMPLHSLRHTAATLWLATPHPLIFVQRQLGHRSITTTEEHYGHFEASFVKRAAEQTEALIGRSTPATNADALAA